MREQVLVCWRGRYPDVALVAEFVDLMPLDARIGKFENIERLIADAA